MLTGTRQTLRAHPSLLSLRAALTAAESGVPSRPRWMDVNERRALQLIARMQAEYKKTLPFLDGCDIPALPEVHVSFHEMAGTHAG